MKSSVPIALFARPIPGRDLGFREEAAVLEGDVVSGIRSQRPGPCDAAEPERRVLLRTRQLPLERSEGLPEHVGLVRADLARQPLETLAVGRVEVDLHRLANLGRLRLLM